MASLNSITMLSPADLYFTDGEGNYRLQWSTTAIVDRIARPKEDDDEEYFIARQKYDTLVEHANDGSDQAASFVCRVYDKKTGTKILEVPTTGHAVDVALNPNGEYVWEVAALDRKGTVITTSGRNYICTGFAGWDNDPQVCFRNSSPSHQMSEVGEYYGTVNLPGQGAQSGRLAVGAQIDNTADGTVSRFLVCGPGNLSNEGNYAAAGYNGYEFSVSNAFGNLDGDFLASGRYLLSNGGLYTYAGDGQWDYQAFVQPWMWSSDGFDDGEYFYVDDDGSALYRTIFRWDAASRNMVEVRTASKLVFRVTKDYFLSLDGLYSIKSGAQIVKADLSFGETVPCRGGIVNVLARKSGRSCDELSPGSTGTVTARYWLYDAATRSMKSYEEVLFSGRVDSKYSLDSEEMFCANIGNCVCYNLNNQYDYYDEPNTAIVHVLNDDGTITVITRETRGRAEFRADADGNLICDYQSMNHGYRSEVLTSGLVLAAPDTVDVSIVDADNNNWTDMKTAGAESEEIDEFLLADGCAGIVGQGDPDDYLKFHLDTDAKVILDVTATGAATVTVNELGIDKKGNYALTARQTVKVNGKPATGGALLLEAGDYYLGVRSPDAAKGGSARYMVALNGGSVFFTDGDNGWNDFLYDAKTKKVKEDVTDDAPLEIDVWTDDVILDSGVAFGEWNNFMGYGDKADYKKIHLEHAGKLSFTVTAADAAKFTISQLTLGKNDTYSVKVLQTTAVSLDKKTQEYAATTKTLMLEAGDYYLGVESSNAAKGGAAYYNVELNDSVFFTDGDNGWNDFLYDAKTKKVKEDVTDDAPLEIDAWTDDVILDSGVAFGKWNNFTGYGDKADYKKIHLEHAGKLSFTVTAADAAKFTISQLTPGKNGTYSVKVLQTTAVSLDKNTQEYAATTKTLMLEAGDYYLGVEASNAAKGGAAYYNVELNDSVFFADGDDGWNDFLYDAKTKMLNGAVTDDDPLEIDAGTGEVVLDSSGEFGEWSNFTGYGDAADYKKIHLKHAGKLSFTVTAADAVKFTVSQLTLGKNDTYSVKVLQTTAVSLDKNTQEYAATTQTLLLEAGDYYLGVESSNAAKGGAAYYNVELNDDSVFFSEGDHSDDTWEGAGDFGTICADAEMTTGPAEDWVGFGDDTDFRRFSVEADMQVSFNVGATDAVKFTVWQMVGGRLKSLQSTSFKAGVAGSTKALALKQDGEYYFSVESTNAAKGGSADYTVTGGRFAAPLELTLKGGKDYNMDVPEFTVPAGTSGADKITFAGDTFLRVSNDIILKDGADQIIHAKSSGKTQVGVGGIDMGAGDDLISVGAHSDLAVFGDIDFGDGNDTLTLLAHGDLRTEGSVDFGSGNDTMTLSGESSDFQAWYGKVDFGSGNDTLTVGGDADFHAALGEVDFGSGNDTLTIAADGDFSAGGVCFGDGNDQLDIAKGGVFAVEKRLIGQEYDPLSGWSEIWTAGTLDFGGGSDSLTLNGTMILSPGNGIPGLEKVSGTGQLLLEGSPDNGEDYQRFIDAGINVVNVQGIIGSKAFTDRKTELADNHTKNAAAIEIKDKDKFYANMGFWLCGEELAENSLFGFADPVDCIKFTMDSRWTELRVDSSAPVSFELRNAEREVLAGAIDTTWETVDLIELDLARGATYYIRLSVPDDSWAVGNIQISAYSI